jgi:hypothetical protein
MRDEAARRGVALNPMSDYYLDPAEDSSLLLLGYARSPEPVIPRGGAGAGGGRAGRASVAPLARFGEARLTERATPFIGGAGPPPARGRAARCAPGSSTSSWCGTHTVRRRRFRCPSPSCSTRSDPSAVLAGPPRLWAPARTSPVKGRLRAVSQALIAAARREKGRPPPPTSRSGRPERWGRRAREVDDPYTCEVINRDTGRGHVGVQFAAFPQPPPRAPG